MNNNNPIKFYAVGDIGPCRENPRDIFSLCKSELLSADLVFGQLEPCLSRRGTPSPQARLAMRTDPSVAEAIKSAGIDVVSWASNHCMDWGTDAFADTLENLRKNNISVVGAGNNIVEARKPVIKTINNTRIAILAYCSILPQGYWAEENRSGCAPMRAFTVNEQIEHDQPGTPQRTHTFAHREDLELLKQDIRRVNQTADVVVVSFHWGLHFVPVSIADYQRQVAHAAIDAGANLIVGHHPHIIKGIEVYRDAAIFYSLGNFAIEAPTAFAKNVEKSQGFQEIKGLNKSWGKNRKVLLPEESFMSCVVSCQIADKKIKNIGFLPCQINESAQPKIISRDESQFETIEKYIKEISEKAEFKTEFEQVGDLVEVLV